MHAASQHSIAAKLTACLALTALADLFLFGQSPGAVAGLFAAALLGMMVALQPALLQTAPAKFVAAALAGLVLALLDAPDTLTLWCFAGGIASLLVLHKRAPDNAVLWAKDVLKLSLRAPFQWWRDMRRIDRATLRRSLRKKTFRGVIGYAVFPLALAGLFIWLFAQANPVLDLALGRVDWRGWFGGLADINRWLFWGVTAAALWALFRPRFRLAQPVTASLAKLNTAKWVSRHSLVLSLVLFNLIFAVQNGFDLAFLWTGQGVLPEGVTFASYAHAGAYPLIVTALLAGGYVLVTFDTAQIALRSTAATALVTGWVLQNVFLVVSSIDRTLNYISAYSLTYLRIAALVWMALVALGLPLILARIYLQRSNMWLVNMNAVALAVVLYACCFPDFGRLIADYNVHHAREVAGNPTAADLDLDYLTAIGPAALPALNWYLDNVPDSYSRDNGKLAAIELQERLAADIKDWHRWTWREQRLAQKEQYANPSP